MRCINDNKSSIVEGKLRCQQLSEYLNQRNAGADVWLCEDGSGIIPKILYDATTNQLIGMSLPIDEETGCPKRYASTASDAAEIEQFLQHKKSTMVYIVVAVPLKEGVPPFILQMYGTDNTFNSESVVRRWNFTVAELKRLLLN